MEETSTKTITKTKIKHPPMYKVILMNDDETTFDFVIFILEDVFLKSTDEAIRLSYEADSKGSAVIGIYTRDIAQSKIDIVERYKSQMKFPLELKLLPE